MWDCGAHPLSNSRAVSPDQCSTGHRTVDKFKVASLNSKICWLKASRMSYKNKILAATVIYRKVILFASLLPHHHPKWMNTWVLRQTIELIFSPCCVPAVVQLCPSGPKWVHKKGPVFFKIHYLWKCKTEIRGNPPYSRGSNSALWVCIELTTKVQCRLSHTAPAATSQLTRSS